MVIALFGVIAFRLLRAAQIARDPLGRMLCAGALALLAFSVFQNVGMTIGLIPIAGIPLPFVSYGGSAMIVFFATVGLVVNVEMRRSVTAMNPMAPTEMPSRSRPPRRLPAANGDGSVLAAAGPDATLGAPVAEDATDPDVAEDADESRSAPEPVVPEEPTISSSSDDVDTVTQDGQLELRTSRSSRTSPRTPGRARVRARAGGGRRDSDLLVTPPEMSQMLFVDVVLLLPATHPVVVLQEADPPYRELSIPVGGAEGIAIGYAARGLETPRPLTHELLARILEEFGMTLDVVRITQVHGTAFHRRDRHLRSVSEPASIDCRPSDAIALALRHRLPVPIMASPIVLARAGSDPPGNELRQAPHRRWGRPAARSEERPGRR